MSKTLYPFQQSAREQINANLNRKINTVFLSPCGSGKTFTSTSIISDRVKQNRRVFILVPQTEIFSVWIDELHEHDLNPGYINDEGIRGRDRKVYVCMTLSLVNILHTLDESLWPDEIIIDEVQHMLATSWLDVCGFFIRNNNASLLGLTATLYHGSGNSFEPYFQEIIQTITKPEAIKKGYITQPIPIVPDDLLRDFDIPVVGDDFDTEKQAALLGDVQIIGSVIDTYELTFTGKPVLVACATYRHAKIMTDEFNKAGWKFEHIHSKLPKHERKRMLKAVAEQKINGLCTVGIGIEGMSIKGLWGILWLRRTLSPIIWTQFNGRAERLYPGKKYAFIVDFVGNTFIHGMPDKERTWTLDGGVPDDDTDKTTMKVCPFCGVMNAAVNEICHFCGKVIMDENGNTPKTCLTCGNYLTDENNLPCAVGVFNEMFMLFSGCESWKKKARKLPIMVDGKLVAITREGMEDIRIHADEVKADIVTSDRENETARQVRELKELTANEKRSILRSKKLFDGKRRGMFTESLSNFI